VISVPPAAVRFQLPVCLVLRRPPLRSSRYCPFWLSANAWMICVDGSLSADRREVQRVAAGDIASLENVSVAIAVYEIVCRRVYVSAAEK